MNHRVLVADGHWLVRRGLRATLQHQHGYLVVGEADSAAEAVSRTAELAPDLVLLDLKLPQAGGIAALQLIKKRSRTQKVLLLSDAGGEDSVREALRAGADGIVRKDESDRELLEAMHCVLAGSVYLDAEMTRQLVLDENRREMHAGGGPLHELSPRELAVFRLIGAGLTNRGAGEQLELSPKTVEKYRATVMHKLGLRDAVELRLLALELGMAPRSGALVANTASMQGVAA
jgi:DNA-binding NarL/FixJ family response regulator